MEQQSLIEWIRTHAPLEELCQLGGRPDPESIEVTIESETVSAIVVEVLVDELVDEGEHRRGGQFTISLDEHGNPAECLLTGGF